MNYQNKGISEETQLQLYRNLLKPRMVEEKMLILLRQGKISKWFSGIGQEAISVGVTMALNEEEYILPMHRNLGVFTTRAIPLHRLFSQWQGKANGFTNGRDRSFHFGTQAYKIIGMYLQEKEVQAKVIFMRRSISPRFGIYRFYSVLKITDTDYRHLPMNSIDASIW